MSLSNIIFDICPKIIDNSPDTITYKALCLVCKIFWKYSEFSSFLIKVSVKVSNIIDIKQRYRNIEILYTRTHSDIIRSFPNIKRVSIDAYYLFTNTFTITFYTIFPNLEEFCVIGVGTLSSFVFPNFPNTCKKLIYFPTKVCSSLKRNNTILSLEYYGNNIYYLLRLIDVLVEVKNISVQYDLFINCFVKNCRCLIERFIKGDEALSVLIGDEMMILVNHKIKLSSLNVNLYIMGYGLIKIEKMDLNNIKLIKDWIV